MKMAGRSASDTLSRTLKQLTLWTLSTVGL